MDEPADNKITSEINTATENDLLLQATTREINHGRLFWREISWRFALAIIFSVLIVAILYSFSNKGNLSRWEMRWFNVLTILFSSLVSLMMGSLLGLLGSMLRWKLLARRPHKPMDVDLILGMPNPTGSFRLIWHHTRSWRWSTTTAMVMTYLVVNIVGRLSVASFGLTYDMNELPGIEYPVRLTDWSTPEWFNASQPYRQISDHASVGLPMVSTEFEPKNSATFTLINASGQGLDRKVDGNKVTYSYALKEFLGPRVNSAENRMLHSSSSCVGSMMWGSSIYTNGTLVGKVNETDKNSPNLIHMLDALFAFYSGAEINYIWLSQLGVNDAAGPGCATTYIYAEDYTSFEEKYKRNSTIFECTTCLSDTNNKPGIGTDVLFGQAAENASRVTGLLHHFGAYERVFADYSYSGRSSFATRLYSSQNLNSHFLNDRNSALENGATAGAPRVKVSAEAELYAAHLAARRPLLAIIGAESHLPKVTREQGASERPYIAVVLEVKWHRTVGVLTGILLGQVAAIVIVKWICRKVFLRDHDSFLSMARLLRTAVGDMQGHSTEQGTDMAAALEENLVARFGDSRLRYGTRHRGGEYWEADLWRDVKNNFPPGLYA